MKKVWIFFLLLLSVAVLALIWEKFVQQSRLPQQNITQSNLKEQSSAGESSELPTTCTGKQLPSLTEGPYYKSGSPERRVIREDKTPTTKLTLEGYVFDTDCKPVSNAWIDFWQADGNGKYDNNGYLLRGHQYTNKDGSYSLETVVPGLYPGRTEHIHFKIRANNKSPIITSQLFLPASTSNRGDSIFDEALLINMIDKGNEKYATYNFIISSD